ncbi:MAG TPA: S41 family peptidase [Leeuwenhoekiella sp.]|nr:S41 family peptidase [Leeuwenhoekiella sp.]
MAGYQKKYLPLFLGIAVALGIGLGSQLNYSSNTGLLSKTNAKKEKLNRLIDYIDYEYVDDVNTDSIVDVTVNNILENLDPHSVYIPPTEMQRMSESMKGDFVGIGVSFYTENDSIVVINAIKDGPSDLAGIMGGDRIVSANGVNLTGKSITNDSLVGSLKGKINTTVDIKIKRPGQSSLMDVEVTRDVVPIISIDASYMLTDKLGYVKINRFAETTPDEFRNALQKLKRKGATQIALDLRDNPGGYISAAEQVVDEFLKEDKLILFTKNKTGKIENTFATDGGIFENAPVYVLVNENSASASEIVAGAMQDNDQGTIIGRRTFGKGLVQREMELGDGSAVRLTIARYYTPTGRSIQRPYDDGNKAYYEEYLHRYQNGEMISQDSIKVDDSLRFTTPGGKVVYGGGGIIPDVFVAKETEYEKESIDYALRSGFMSRYVFNLLERDRTYYNKLSLPQFKAEVEISDADIKDFVSYGARREIKIRVKDYKEELKQSVKAVMAQQLFGTTLYEQMINKDDAMVKKVISLSKKS